MNYIAACRRSLKLNVKYGQANERENRALISPIARDIGGDMRPKILRVGSVIWTHNES